MRPNPVVLVLMIALATLVAAAATYPIALDGCEYMCGNVEIPYSFGLGRSSTTGNNCSLDESFELTSNESSTLLSSNVPILNISLQGQLDVSFCVSQACYNRSDIVPERSNYPDLSMAAFTINSTENKFITVGCDSYGYLHSKRRGKLYSTGCLTRCQNGTDEENKETCSGIGCCLVDIPVGMKNISIKAYGFDNQTIVLDFNNCSYAFIAKRGSYKFNTSHMYRGLPNESFPLVVDWAVGDERSCEDAKSKPDYACQKNSHCNTTHHIDGYRCICNDGYEGNPYHPHGCQNINECQISKHNCVSGSSEYSEDFGRVFQVSLPVGIPWGWNRRRFRMLS